MAAPPQGLGVAGAPLRFTPRKSGPRGWGNRCLTLDGADAFELSFWCGTCPFIFERKKGANRTLSSPELTPRLNPGPARSGPRGADQRGRPAASGGLRAAADRADPEARPVRPAPGVLLRRNSAGAGERV